MIAMSADGERRQFGRSFTRRTLIAGLIVGATAIGATLNASLAVADDGIIAAGGSGRPEKTAITFGVALTADHAPLYLGVNQGFFKQEGLDVTVRTTNPANAVTSLLSGELDVTSVTFVQIVTGAKQGVLVSVVAEVDRASKGYTAYVVKAGSPTKTLADLARKKIGVPQLNGICDFLLNDDFRAAGIAYGSVQYVALPFADLVPTVLSGGVESICLPEPLLTPTLEQGTIISVHDLFSGQHDNWPIGTYAVSPSFAKANPNTIGALQRALAKSRALAREKPEMVRQVLPTYAPIKPELANKIVLPEYPGTTDRSAVNRVVDLLKRVKFLSPDFTFPKSSG